MVEPTTAGSRLTTVNGHVYRLVLTGSATPIHSLDGHLVDVWGPQFLRTVRVARWTVGEGLHGMPTWVGELVPMGDQLGIQDRNSGVFYMLDDKTAALLGPSAGGIALIEGYVDGPHRVKAVYYRILED